MNRKELLKEIQKEREPKRKYHVKNINHNYVELFFIRMLWVYRSLEMLTTFGALGVFADTGNMYVWKD